MCEREGEVGGTVGRNVGVALGDPRAGGGGGGLFVPFRSDDDDEVLSASVRGVSGCIPEDPDAALGLGLVGPAFNSPFEPVFLTEESTASCSKRDLRLLTAGVGTDSIPAGSEDMPNNRLYGLLIQISHELNEKKAKDKRGEEDKEEVEDRLRS